MIRRILISDKADEAADGGGADAGPAGVGGGGIGPAMDDGIADFNARGISVDDDPAAEALELADESQGDFAVIGLADVNGSREAAFDFFYALHGLRDVAAADDQSARAEGFFVKRRLI